MIIISHRGIVDTSTAVYPENSPEAVKYAIQLGFQVEVDLRHIDKKWYLGHDKPEYQVGISWLVKMANYLWIHCKDIDTYHQLEQINIYDKWKFFLHDRDDMAIVLPHNLWWTYPGKPLCKIRSIAVLPESSNNAYTDYELFSCYGICTDYPLEYRDKYNDYLRSM